MFFLNPGQNLTDVELEEVSKYIGSNYQLVGVALGLTTVQIDQVLMKNPFCGRTLVFRMLVAWRDTFREATAKEKLITVLTKYISMTDVEEIQQMFRRKIGDAAQL